MLDRATIEAAIEEHLSDPGRRTLQKLLAKEVTVMVHGEEAYRKAVEASALLFSPSTSEKLRELDEQTFVDVFSGVPSNTIEAASLPCPIIEFLATRTNLYPSKGEARKGIQGGGVSINKDRISDIDYQVSEKDIIDGKYILFQKGKKNYFLVTVK